MIGLMD